MGKLQREDFWRFPNFLGGSRGSRPLALLAVLGRVLADAILERGLKAAHLDWLDYQTDKQIQNENHMRKILELFCGSSAGRDRARMKQKARRREPIVGQEAVSARRRKRHAVHNQWSQPRQVRLDPADCLSVKGVTTPKQRFDRAVGPVVARFSGGPAAPRT